MVNMRFGLIHACSPGELRLLLNVTTEQRPAAPFEHDRALKGAAGRLVRARSGRAANSDLAGDPCGPQVHTETRLQSGDGLQVGPRGSTHDVADGSVVHSGGRLSGSQSVAALSQHRAQSKRQASRNLDGRLIAGDVRPLLDPLSGSFPFRPDHGANLRPVQPTGRDLYSTVGARAYGRFYHQDKRTRMPTTATILFSAPWSTR